MDRNAVFLASMALAAVGLWGQGSGSSYRPAGVSKAGDIPFPSNSTVTGLVTLGISVGSDGSVQNVSVIRDLPPLTAAAQDGLKNWQFAPAVENGKMVEGNCRVQIIFNPFNPGDTTIPGGSEPAATAADGSDAEFQPAQLESAEFASYPENTVASGTVVLQLGVDAEGGVSGARVFRGAGPLAGAATRTAKNWKFTAATYKGTAVSSVVPVAFVFASPAQGTP